MDDTPRSGDQGGAYEKPKAEDLPTAESPSVTAAGDTNPQEFGE